MNDLRAIESSLAVIDFAQGLPMDMLTKHGDRNVYPSSASEHIVAYILGLLLPHEWDDDEFDILANQLTEPLSQLDMGVDKTAAWQELFAVAAQVRKDLGELEVNPPNAAS